MLRIDSYITSRILSFVDRYIKNFRQQDAQVSLWEGDGSFQNLNLDLEVLEQELNLPFSFVSGHIHELLIHVPWTRLTSEPVQITINTIECVMKLKPPGSESQQPKTTRKTTRAAEDPQGQSSLVSSLVNKIICNLSVTCNNLILKYVEEDIVLSMNIKTLSFGTVDNNWEPAFMELSPTQLELRKLISLSDVTICLDKRSASGRIESYLEPLLYRCFMTVRLWQSYTSVNAKRASSTRMDVHCEQMAFTVSEPQLPMLMRLIGLVLALRRRQNTQNSLAPVTEDSAKETNDDDGIIGQPGDPGESWSSWAVSWMPSLVPLSDYGDDYDQYLDNSGNPNSLFNFGFYVDSLTLDLKLCQPDGSGGLKTQPQAFMHILLQGCHMDLISHNLDWTNVQMGICQASIKPDGDCCCGITELVQMVYLNSGEMRDSYFVGSLFDKEPSQLQDPIVYSWRHHLDTVSETILLEKSPAFAMDYLSCIQSEEEDSDESDDEDEERLPAKEKVVIRYVAGPVVVKVCSGLIHRVQMLMKACASYDYVPYSIDTAQPTVPDNQVLDLVHRLSERSVEMDEDLYSRYLPIHTSQFTAFSIAVELYPANHLPVHMSTLGRKLSRPQRKSQSGSSAPLSPPPCVIMECNCVYATVTRPLYPDKILLMASKFQRDKLPQEIVTTSLTRLAFKAVGVSSSVRLPFHQSMKVVEISSISSEQSWHSLITPLDENISSDVTANIENLTLTSSKAKLVLLHETVSSLFATNNRQRYLAAHFTIYNTTLLTDAANNADTIYLKLVVEQGRVRRVVTGLSTTVSLVISACQVFAVRLLDKSEEWDTMIVNAPDTNTPTETPLLEVLYQQPVSLNVFPPLVTFKLQEVRFSADPLLYAWLLYVPTPTATFATHPPLKPHKSAEQLKSRKVSDSSLSSYLRRAPTPQESLHGSSERETSNHPSSQPHSELAQTVPVVPWSDRIANYYPVWKTMIVCGDVSQLSIYLPQNSLASPTPLTMEEGLQSALRTTSASLQVAVIKLPSVTLRCGNYKQGIQQYTQELPVRLPHSVWNLEKDNFPWIVTISDLHCFTLRGVSELPLLKPVSFNCTIGTSPKFNDQTELTSLALCVHLDTTPVNIKISAEQVVLLVNLFMAQMKVLNVLLPSTPSEPAPATFYGSDESSSVSQCEESARGGGPVKVKLTGWLQWTLARTTLSLYSKSSLNTPEELKLTLDVEDIILSLDVERIYHKIKFKVATASVCHYTRKNLKESWKKGAFQGLVMRGYDPDRMTLKHSADDNQAPGGFLMATVTRAKCNNFHSRLGSPSKQTAINKKSMKSDQYITEIEVKMQPLDFVLSPTTLGMFTQVLEPLTCLTQTASKEQSVSSAYRTGILPLLYLDLMTIRVVLPTSRDHLKPNQPDVLIIQFDGMAANPHPENPICRNPLRPDIYHKGEKQRILNIPGSELEDRQYQFTLTNIQVQTGLWHDLEKIFVREVAVSSKQNPALDWNEGRSQMFQVPADQLMHPLLNPFNLSVVLAPAMFYMDKDIVCGHAAEVNATTDIVVALTLDQLFLCSLLSCEIRHVLHSRPKKPCLLKVNNVTVSPTSVFNQNLTPEQDSGLESTESVVSHAKPVDPNLPAVHAVSSSGYSQVSGLIHSSLPSTVYPTPLVWPSKRTVIPYEVLVTGGSVTLCLFDVEFSSEIVYEPLLNTHVFQPHVFLCRNADNMSTCQASMFDLGVSCGVKGYSSPKQVPSKPFAQPLLETRNGDPDPITGIPPAFFTSKVSWKHGKAPKIETDLGRPIKIICKLESVEYLKTVKELVSTSLYIPAEKLNPIKENTTSIKGSSLIEEKEHWLREVLRRFSKFHLNTQQIMLAVSSSVQNGAELCVSVAGISVSVASTLSLQQAVTGTMTLDAITVSTHKVTSPKTRLVLQPWQLSIQTSLSWDSWLSTCDTPQAVISAYSDVLSIHFSPEQLHCLTAVCQDYAPLLQSSGKPHKHPVLSRESSRGDSISEEQQYHDDLQAGVFQFVESESGVASADLPLSYQVLFCSGLAHTPTMAWRYPQPRTLNKFCLLPVPFREVPSVNTLQPVCYLQYYSESQACYLDLAQFTLSQTDSQVVQWSQFGPRVVAAVWRVVLSRDASLVIPVKALAASIRVDSYFAPSLVPSVQLSVNLTAVQLFLWTYTDSYLPLPKPIERYYLDKRFPEEHDFLTAVLEQANVSFSVWPNASHQVTVKGRARVDVLNYCTLSNQCCILPFPLAASGYLTTDCTQWSLVSGNIHVCMGPALSHSLASSLHTWAQYYSLNKPTCQTVLTPYVICNNTCMPIRFRQAGSDEYISLQCFQCHLYSWRTTKHSMQLEFGLFEPETNDWSKGLNLDVDSNSVIKLTSSGRELAFIVSVKRLTSTVRQVVINGQLALHNSLSMPIEVRIIPECGEQQSSLVVGSGNSPPTVVIDPRYSVSLKVRFTTLSNLWSGEIPLQNTNKTTMQWEVKLPLKERGQYRSVWCHIVWNMVEDIHQLLVVLSPLYTIKSMLPCEANALVETPALTSSQVVLISGRGVVQHLDTPGLSDETHNLTFQLDGRARTSNPPVSLHYRMLDGSPSPEPVEEDIMTLVNRLQRKPCAEWPLLGKDWASVDWLVTTQPDTVTQVKVRFSDDCVATNALLVEVQPWALLVNTLGTTVYLQGQERTLCSLTHCSVISPSPLESTFQIGVEMENSVHLSDPIQLKRGPGFEMPHIPGLLSPTGFISSTVTSEEKVCFMNVTSCEVNSMRLIHIKSSYVVASLSKRELSVAPVAVRTSITQHSLPGDLLRHSVSFRPQANTAKLKCQPLTEWTVLGVGEGELVPHLVVGAGATISCPVKIPAGTERQSVSIIFPAAEETKVQQMLVMTIEKIDGQTQILLWDQPCPQLTIHNQTNSTILFSKAKTEGRDCELIKWQLRLEAGEIANYSFPAPSINWEVLPQSTTLPAATIAVVSADINEVKWSDAVSLTHCSGRLLTLLGLPDLSLSVNKRGFTTHVTLSQASHTEILAVDIRGQLSRHLLDERRSSDLSGKSEKEDSEAEQELSAPSSLPPSEIGNSDGRGLDVSLYIHGLTTTLLSPSDKGCESKEVAALTLDRIGVTLHPYPHQDPHVREMKIHTTIGDLQLDNEEFSEGGYDFPVVLLMQRHVEPKSAEPVMSDHARKLVEQTRSSGSAMDLTVIVDTNSHPTIALQDISVKFSPMQIYIEDKYILYLKERLLDAIPLSIFSEGSSQPSTKPKATTSQKSTKDTRRKSKDVQKIQSDEKDTKTEDITKDQSDGSGEEDLFNVSEPDLDNRAPEASPSIVAEATDRPETPVFESDPWSSQPSSSQKEVPDSAADATGFPIAAEVLSASRDLARPLRLRSLSISDIDLLVSIHTSTRVYIALDHSPLQLAAFKRSSLFTTAYRLGHSLTLHYFFGAIYGTGWALGSLELLGAPGGLARSLGLGLRDFISLPLQGILVGPRAFFIGIAHGSASLMQHFAAGTITSVTRLASSWARTLDRLTLDNRDLERSEQLRRLRPQSLTQGVMQGLTEFGISLIGAISSIAHHPLQYAMSETPNRSLVSSVGLGLVGVITRPLSGVAELVALTGEGLLSGVGWANTPAVRHKPQSVHVVSGTDSRLKYQWKLLSQAELLLLITEATTDCYEAVTLLVTNRALYVVNSELDIIQRAVLLTDLQPVSSPSDPTLVAFRIQPAKEQAQQLSQARIVEYVRESQRVHGEVPPSPSTSLLDDEPHLQFYINPNVRNHFLIVLTFATRHALGRGFPLISKGVV